MVQTKFIMPSWEEVCSLAFELSQKVRRGFSPDTVIGVVRGGLVPARLLADSLEVSTMLTVGVSFYKDIAQREKQPRITQALPFHMSGEHLLVVDDVADTGKSLELVLSELKKAKRDARTATLYKKPWVEFNPDFYVRQTDAWIIFPWERMETVRKIAGHTLSPGKSLKDIEDQLVSHGMELSIAQSLVKHVARERTLS